jgi:ATP-dependent DNA helicase RecG
VFISIDSDLATAVKRMRLAGTDLAEYELKSAAGGFPKSTTESISAFANTLGGTIVFGIAEKGGFHVVDIDARSIQASLAQAARDLVEPPQAVDIRVLNYEDRPVVVANVPEAPVREKPCYVRRLGMMSGSFIRTGDGDHKMSQYEIDRFIENQSRTARNDAEPVFDATVDDLDKSLLAGWLARVRETSFGRAAAMSDEELMANRRVVALDAEGVAHPTLAGLLAMGSYPQAFFPRLNVVFTAYPADEKGKPGAGGMRFADSVNIDGPIPAMVVDAVRTVYRNIGHGAVVDGALREDAPDYPLAAVREAVANALMHRDYSLDARGTPVSIDLFPDRLEIDNPGGLFGALTVDGLGSGGATASRNQFLARILEDVPYSDYDGRSGRVVENRGSGYPTINHELATASMRAAEVTSTLTGFDIVFRRGKAAGEETSGCPKVAVEKSILEFLAQHETASMAQIAEAVGAGVKTTRGYVSTLMERGEIVAVGARTSPKRKYCLAK